MKGKVFVVVLAVLTAAGAMWCAGAVEVVDGRFAGNPPLLITRIRPSNVGDGYIKVMNNLAEMSLALTDFEVYQLVPGATSFGWAAPAATKIQLLAQYDAAEVVLQPGEERLFAVPEGTLLIDSGDATTTQLYYGVKYGTARTSGNLGIYGCLRDAGWKEGTVCELEPGSDVPMPQYVWRGNDELVRDTGESDGAEAGTSEEPGVGVGVGVEVPAEALSEKEDGQTVEVDGVATFDGVVEVDEAVAADGVAEADGVVMDLVGVPLTGTARMEVPMAVMGAGPALTVVLVCTLGVGWFFLIYRRKCYNTTYVRKTRHGGNCQFRRGFCDRAID
jgi:hypothetical protein